MLLILIRKIISMALMIVMGFLLVKCRVLKSEDSKPLSALSLYLITPCMILSAFQIDYTDERRNGLLLALLAAVLIHALMLALTALIRKPLRLNPVEQASLVYTNSGNLTIPLVIAILGRDWVIYASAYIVVSLILLWSHGKSLLCSEKGFSIKKLLLNINMLAIFAGALLFFLRIPLPPLLAETADTVGDMIGPVAMLIIGMLLGGMSAKAVAGDPRVWLIVGLRLIALPLVLLPLLKFSGISRLAADGGKVLLVTLLATASPAASAVTQLAQVYEKDADRACAINILSTLFCIATIPLMVLLYNL